MQLAYESLYGLKDSINILQFFYFFIFLYGYKTILRRLACKSLYLTVNLGTYV